MLIRVLDLEDVFIAFDAVGAKRDVPWEFTHRKSNLCLVPLPISIDEADHSGRRIADLGAELYDPVEFLFRYCVKDLAAVKLLEAFLFIFGPGDVDWRFALKGCFGHKGSFLGAGLLEQRSLAAYTKFPFPWILIFPLHTLT